MLHCLGKARTQMASLPHELRSLRSELPRPRVQRAKLAMISVSLVTASSVVGLVMGHRRPAAVVAFGRLFSHRTWQAVEAVAFLFLVAMTVVARQKRRDRT
jgi:hypothetical protein